MKEFTRLYMFDRDAITIYRWLEYEPHAYPNKQDLMDTIIMRRGIYLCEHWPKGTPYPDTSSAALDIFEAHNIEGMDEAIEEACYIMSTLPYERRFQLAWDRQLHKRPCPLIFMDGKTFRRVRPAPKKPTPRYNSLLDSIKAKKV